MGQIVSAAAKPKRCNNNQLSQLGVLAAGLHVLVSSDNSMNAAGQGNFDCYIVGDGATAATALPLQKIDELWQYFLTDTTNLFPPTDVVVQKSDDNVTYSINGTTLSVTVSVNVNKWFYIKISDGAKTGVTYNVTFTATNVGTSPVRSSTNPRYDDTTLTPDGNGVYSFSFVGGTDTWIGLQNVRYKTCSLDNITIVNANPETIFDNSIIKNLEYNNLKDEVAEKIQNAAQYEMTPLQVVKQEAIGGTEVTLISIDEDNGAMSFQNTAAATKSEILLFSGEAGHTYKLKITTTQRGTLAVLNLDNATISTASFPQGGGTSELTFTMPSDGVVRINVGTYANTTQVVTNFFAYDITSPDQLPVDQIVALPQENVLREYNIIDRNIMYIPNGSDIDVFLHGMVDTYTDNDKFAMFCNYAWVTINGFEKHFRIGASVSGSDMVRAYIYDQFRREVFYLNRIPVTETNPSSNKNVFIVGDSLTARKTLPTEFKTYLNNAGLTNVTMIGQYVGNISGANYEAVGSRAWPDYTQDPSTLPSGHTNPFWINGALDYAAYFNTYCGGEVPDVVVCELGWNQIIVYSMTDAEITTLIHTFIDGIVALNANCKFVLCGIHRGKADDYNYYRRQYLEGSVRLAKIYQAVALDPNYSDKVIYGNIAPYFDGDNGIQMAERRISQWSTDVEQYVVDPVHPNDLGMKMHAYAMYLHTLYWLNRL